MIATITLNPSLDYHVVVPSFKEGILNRSEGESLIPGGKGINVSCVLGSFGFKTKAYGFVAGETGSMFIHMLQQRNIDCDFCTLSTGETRINVKLKSSVETEINGQGPFISEKDFSLLCGKLGLLGHDDALVLSGNIPTSMKKNAYAEILKKIGGQTAFSVVDSEGESLLDTLQFSPFLIKPNKQELGNLFHTNVESFSDVTKFGNELRKMGARNVLVSLGDQGAVLFDEEGHVFIARVPTGNVLNSVGAGDSMVAGFLAEYLQNHSFKKALARGAACGSASAFTGVLATKESSDKLIDQIIISEE